MKKKITLTISDESYDFLKTEFINVSAFIESVIQRKIRQSRMIVDKENGLTKEEEDVLDAI